MLLKTLFFEKTPTNRLILTQLSSFCNRFLGKNHILDGKELARHCGDWIFSVINITFLGNVEN
jgi:hypothetical protein